MIKKILSWAWGILLSATAINLLLEIANISKLYQLEKYLIASVFLTVFLQRLVDLFEEKDILFKETHFRHMIYLSLITTLLFAVAFLYPIVPSDRLLPLEMGWMIIAMVMCADFLLVHITFHRKAVAEIDRRFIQRLMEQAKQKKKSAKNEIPRIKKRIIKLKRDITRLKHAKV